MLKEAIDHVARMPTVARYSVKDAALGVLLLACVLDFLARVLVWPE